MHPGGARRIHALTFAMFITGIGTASPATCYSQRECWDVFAASDLSRRLDARSRAIVKKVLNGKNGITTRHLVLGDLREAFELTPDVLHARFLKHAPALASQAAEQALASAGTTRNEIDALIISTCTGYLCPGLTSYVAERLGLRPDVFGLDLVGQGCGAAVPNLRVGEALVTSGRARHVLSICVEVCSAALYFDNDPGVLISACLFGDGAGAAVLSREPANSHRLEWKHCGTLLKPADRDLLRFEHRDGMLRNILTPAVPALAGLNAKRLFDDVMTEARISPSEVKAWALHPGGRDVLVALRNALELSEHDTRWSEAVLDKYGNLSSASLYFVLKTALADSAPPGYWWLSSFGAGFSCHGILLEAGN
jgi:predicted naringenin-chalcone synthase